MGDYPEHEKLAAVRDKSQVIGEFLEAQADQGLVLGEWEGERFWPTRLGTERILANYFGIDLEVLEEEKRAMLRAVRGEPELQDNLTAEDTSI